MKGGVIMREINIFNVDKKAKEAIEYARRKSYEVIEIKDAFFIKTNKSNWWIDYSNLENIILYHKNMRISNKKKTNINEEYHVQKKNLQNFITAINYIEKHDSVKYTNKEKSKKIKHNNRMDYLFNLIEQKENKIVTLN